MNEKEDEIQLVIKAPNQNVDDYIVKCNLDWTVGELKEYLSEEYPNKPEVLEQRLIYSGHLLHNHLHLKDVLRQDENEISIYTLHLVCNANDHAHKSQKPASGQNWYNQPTAQSNVNSTPISNSVPESTVRHRAPPFSPPSDAVYTQFQPPTSVIPPLAGDAQVLAQVTAMQQMYAYYINQYMQSMNTTAVTANASLLAEPSNFQTNQNIPHEIPVQRPVHQRLNAQGGQVIEENDEIANRDWFDHLFLFCRFLLFFSMTYFYSTPERLMIVIVCAVVAFLYHEGWFVRRNRPNPVAADVHVPQNRNHQAHPNEDHNENEPILVNQDLSANEELQDGHELEAAMDGNDPPHAQNADLVNNNQIFSPLTFLSAFFSSLIPEPPPPVNIN